MDLPFLLDDEEAAMLRELENVPLLRPPASRRASLPQDTRISVDDPVGAQAAGPSSQGPWSRGTAAAGHGSGSGAATPEDSADPPKDWKTRGLLHTVKAGDINEINRLRQLVDTRLHKAANAQNLARLRELLAEDAKPGALDWEGRTPLHFCVARKLLEPLNVLLRAPGAANVCDASGLPLLHVALLHRWRDGARAALGKGARVDATGPGRIDMFDLTPDHYNMSPDQNNMHRYPDVSQLLFRDSFPRTAIEVAITADMEMLRPILSIAKDRGIIDCLNREGTTALCSAVWLQNMQAVEDLLLNGASPHRVSDKDDTALHVAIHNPHVLTFLLDNTDVKSTLNQEGVAPEHIAVKSKNLDSLKLLLDKFKSTLVKTHPEKHTPLHWAAMIGGDEAAKTILERETGEMKLKAMIEVNAHGDTPLHLAAKHNNRDMTALLLLNGANLSTKTKEDTLIPRDGERDGANLSTKTKDDTMIPHDGEGDTLSHQAPKHKNREKTVRLLLDCSNLSTKVKDDNKTTVLELISTNFYKAEDFFERLFDGFIYKMEIGDTYFVHADYEVLTDGVDMSQIEVLEELVRCGRSKALIHPLIESLLYLKWKHFELFFFILLGVYGMFLVSFNFLMFYIFYFKDVSNNTMDNNGTVSTLLASPASDGGAAWSDSFHGGVYWLLMALTYISILILLLQESMFIYLKRRQHFLSLESWVKLCGLALCACAPLAARAQGPWPRHAACAALLLAWLQAMFLVSRVSRWGYYVLMFGKVAVNILKILVTAIFLVIAFGFCFMIQYRAAAPFDGPFSAFTKTLVMMSSEFEYENLFKEHKDQLLDTETFVRILFVIFVIFVAIVLMNFMTGVAVSDITELNETGNIRRLEKQVELLSAFEPLAYDGVLAKWFIKLFGDRKYHSSMRTSRGNQSTWKVTVRKPPYTDRYKEDATYDIKISSSKLYDAIVETPSKQEEADEEARRLNTERPYRSLMNALNKTLQEKMAGTTRRGEDVDLLNRTENNFNSTVIKNYLLSLVNNSSKTSQDIKLLKQCNEFLSLQINHLTAVSSDILGRVKPGSDWTTLTRRTRRPRRRAARRDRRPADQLLPSFVSEEDPSLDILRGRFDFLSPRW